MFFPPAFVEEIVEPLVVERSLQTNPDVAVLYDFEDDHTYDQLYSSSYNVNQSGYIDWYVSENNDGENVKVK